MRTWFVSGHLSVGLLRHAAVVAEPGRDARRRRSRREAATESSLACRLGRHSQRKVQLNARLDLPHPPTPTASRSAIQLSRRSQRLAVVAGAAIRAVSNPGPDTGKRRGAPARESRRPVAPVGGDPCGGPAARTASWLSLDWASPARVTYARGRLVLTCKGCGQERAVATLVRLEQRCHQARRPCARCAAELGLLRRELGLMTPV